MLQQILKGLEKTSPENKEQYLLNEIAKMNNDLYELAGTLRDITSSKGLTVGTNKLRELSDHIKTVCYHSQAIIYSQKKNDDLKIREAVKAIDKI